MTYDDGLLFCLADAYMFHTVVDVLEDMNQSFSLSIPEEEAAYLTLHFQAAIERMNGISQTKKKAIIVCHMGPYDIR